MQVSELEKYDPSLEIIKGSEVEVKRLSDLNSLENHAALFIRDKKFLEKARPLLGKYKLTLIVAKGLFESQGEGLENEVDALLTSDNINLSMSFLSKVFHDEINSEKNMAVDGRQMGTCDIHPTAWIAQGVFIGDGVRLDENVKIHSGVVIMGETRIGNNCEIFPNVTIYPNTTIGNNCRFHAGVVIGSDGFGYNFKDGVHHKVWHFGGVRIGDDVEIGSNTCIDQGTFSPTIIEDGVKLDNLVQIAHNVRLGRGVILCGQVGVAGSSTVGDYCVFGGKSGMGPSLELGAGSEVAGLGQVTSSFPPKSKIGGHPGRPLKEWLRGIAWVRKQSK